MRQLVHFSVSVVILAAVVSNVLGAEDWPEFRGPQANGISTAKGLPEEWGVEKNVVWKAKLPGRAWSTPIVVGDRIYLTNAVSDGKDDMLQAAHSLRVLALHATTGQVVWDEEVFHTANPQSMGNHTKNSFASASPVFYEGKIYAHFGHFGTVCLDADGKVVWKNTELPYDPVHGNGGCPVVVDGRLIFMADARSEPFVAALDTTSGKLLWKHQRVTSASNTFSFCTPLVIELNDQKQVICVGSNVLTALNPNDGSEIWRVNFDGYSVVPRPVYAHGLVYMSTGYNKATVMAIKVDGQGDVTDTHIEWTLKKGAPLTPSPLVIGDDIYLVADNGLVTCADAKTGEVFWQERVSRQTSASPVYADGKIFIQDEMGTGYVVKAGRSFDILSKNELDERSLASPAVYLNRLLIRTQHALWCFGQNEQ